MIRGRYYMNPALGAAIETARSLGDATQLGDGPKDSFTDDDASDSSHQRDRAPVTAIHRIEIEVAPAPGSSRASGRSSRGYVAHIHREVIDAAPAGASNARSAFGVPSNTPGIPSHSGSQVSPGFVPRGVFAPSPETHVFTTPGDLVNFLRDTLSDE
jgi:hypothetical protein